MKEREDKAVATGQPEFTFAPVVTAQGDGSYVIRPGKPVRKLSLREAAKRCGLSRTTVYRLFDSGLVKGERPSPRKILVYAESLEEHLKRSGDGEFWATGEARKKFLAVI